MAPLAPYDPGWRDALEAEARRLGEALGGPAKRIGPVASTSATDETGFVLATGQRALGAER